MEILTLSEKDMKNPQVYKCIKMSHIVISITSSDAEEVLIPPNVFRQAALHLKFDDISDIDSRYVYFTREHAREILEFVDKHITKIQLIVVQCQAGLSRSVAVGAALSKIINYSDDAVFTRGIPNMFVYTTMLDTFFGEPTWWQKYLKINTIRTKQMGRYLTPAHIKLSIAKEKKRES